LEFVDEMIVGARYDHTHFQDKCYEEILKFSQSQKVKRDVMKVTNYDSPPRFKQTNISSSTDLFDNLSAGIGEESGQEGEADNHDHDDDENSISSMSETSKRLKPKRKKKVKRKKKLKSKTLSTNSPSKASSSDFTRAELMNELLSVKGEVGNALLNFNSELAQLKDNIELQKYQGQDIYFSTPSLDPIDATITSTATASVSAPADAGTTACESNRNHQQQREEQRQEQRQHQHNVKIAGYENEIVSLKSQMKEMLSQLKEVQKQLIDQTNRESKSLKEKERDEMHVSSSQEMDSKIATKATDALTPTPKSMPLIQKEPSVQLSPLPAKTLSPQPPSGTPTTPARLPIRSLPQTQPLPLPFEEREERNGNRKLASDHQKRSQTLESEPQPLPVKLLATHIHRSYPNDLPTIPPADASTSDDIFENISNSTTSSDLPFTPIPVLTTEATAETMAKATDSARAIQKIVVNEHWQILRRGFINLIHEMRKHQNQEISFHSENFKIISLLSLVSKTTDLSLLQESMTLFMKRKHLTLAHLTLKQIFKLTQQAVVPPPADADVEVNSTSQSALQFSFPELVDTLFPDFTIFSLIFDSFPHQPSLHSLLFELIKSILLKANSSNLYEDLGASGLCSQLITLLHKDPHSNDGAGGEEAHDGDRTSTLHNLDLCCLLLERSSNNRYRFGNKLSCIAIAENLKRFVTNYEVIKKLIRLLFMIAKESSTILTRLGENGVCEAIIFGLEINNNRKNFELIELFARGILIGCTNHHRLNQSKFGTIDNFQIILQSIHTSFLTISSDPSAMSIPSTFTKLTYMLEAVLNGNETVIHVASIMQPPFFQLFQNILQESTIQQLLSSPSDLFISTCKFLSAVCLYKSFRSQLLEFCPIFKQLLTEVEREGEGVTAEGDQGKREQGKREQGKGKGEHRKGEGKWKKTRDERIHYLHKTYHKLLALEDKQLQKEYSRSNSNANPNNNDNKDSDDDNDNDNDSSSEKKKKKKKRSHQKNRSKKRLTGSSSKDLTPPLSETDGMRTREERREEDPATDSSSIGIRDDLHRSSSPPQVSLLKSPTPPHPSQSRLSHANKFSSPHRKLIQQPSESFEDNDNDAVPMPMPVRGLVMSSDDLNSVLNSERKLRQLNSHDEAVRVIQKIFRTYQQKKSNATATATATRGRASQEIRILSLLHIIPSSTDSEIILEAVKTGVEAHHEELGLIALKRINELLKIAKESKCHSPVIVLLVHKPIFLIQLLNTFNSNELYLYHGSEVLIRLSYASGACESLGKYQIFPFLFRSLTQTQTQTQTDPQTGAQSESEIPLFQKNLSLCYKLLTFAVRLVVKCPQNHLRAGTCQHLRILSEILSFHFTQPTLPHSPMILEKVMKFISHCLEQSPQIQNNYRDCGGIQTLIQIISTPSLFIPFITSPSSYSSSSSSSKTKTITTTSSNASTSSSSSSSSSVMEALGRLILSLCAFNNSKNLLILGDQRRLRNYLDLYLFFLRDTLSLEGMKSIFLLLSSLYSSSTLVTNPEIQHIFLSAEVDLISALEQALDGMMSRQSDEGIIEEQRDQIISTTLALVHSFVSIPTLKSLFASSNVISIVNSFQNKRYNKKIRKYARTIVLRIVKDEQAPPSTEDDVESD
jgi:hypothetical protein